MQQAKNIMNGSFLELKHCEWLYFCMEPKLVLSLSNIKCLL